MLLRVIPSIIKKGSIVGIGDGAVLVLCLADERLFCLTHKVCRYDEVHRQHEQCKEQQSRAKDQIHDPQFDVFSCALCPLQLITKAPDGAYADGAARLQQLFPDTAQGFIGHAGLHLRVEAPHRAEQLLAGIGLFRLLHHIAEQPQLGLGQRHDRASAKRRRFP